MHIDKNGNRYPNRKAMRMRGYDYSEPGYYFITICSKIRGEIFGKVENGEVARNDLGNIVYNALAITNRMRRETLEIVEGIIMPDHLHLIIHIKKHSEPLPTGNCTDIIQDDYFKYEVQETDDKSHSRLKELSLMVGGFKAAVSKEIGYSVWQRSFFDRIIRDQHYYNNAVQYIKQNPARWEMKYGNQNI